MRRRPIFVVIEFRVSGTLINISARFLVGAQFVAIGTRALETAGQILTVLAPGVALLAFIDVDAIIRRIRTIAIAARFYRR